MHKNNLFLFAALLLPACLSSGAQTATPAQTIASTTLPDTPGEDPALASRAAYDVSSSSDSPAQSPQGDTPIVPPPSGNTTLQTKRILGIIPNFRSVSANQKLPPQTPKEKFITATEDSFDYSAVLLPAALAGYSQATNATPEFRQGAAGFARYFWHSYLDQAIENYSVETIVPILTRQDNRYYTLGTGGFRKRSVYALTRVIITRNDAGHETFNTSEVVGAGMASGISNLYYPSRERTFSNTGQKWGLNVGVDAVTFLFKEFWPDLNNSLFHVKD